MKNKIPKFKNEKEEKAFRAPRDSADCLDLKKGKKTVFPNLKPSAKLISHRLPGSRINEP